jgi:LysW-gamma-L-alpha-aminoadipyl-6-phosphate/LysW-L-glutamyl-5-phosphate reductase
VKRFKAAVYGATGYIGSELLGRLLEHPEVELVRVHAGEHIGEPLGSAQPHLEQLSPLRFSAVPVDERAVEPVDIAFLALPHEVSFDVVRQLSPTQTKLIDCSGAFRASSSEDYATFYGKPHPLPGLLSRFVYGQPELFRAAISGAQWVSSPGCFATAIELGLAPLAKAGVLRGAVHTVGITGSSGSGRAALPTTHHPVRAGNLRTYKPFTHQHVPEIVSTLTRIGALELQLSFVPVSAPLVRGIFVTSLVELDRHVSQAELDRWTDEVYGKERFVRRPTSRLPEVVAVAGSNMVEVALVARDAPGRTTVAALSALDNLVKGGAGQALQSMNLMLGLDEGLGLTAAGRYP